jgi:hypothetical protein
MLSSAHASIIQPILHPSILPRRIRASIPPHPADISRNHTAGPHSLGTRPRPCLVSRHPRNHPLPHPQTHLQHVQQGRLACIVETEEQKLGVLVQETKRGQNIVDCSGRKTPISKRSFAKVGPGITSAGAAAFRYRLDSVLIAANSLQVHQGDHFAGAKRRVPLSGVLCPGRGMGDLVRPWGSGGRLTPVDDPHGEDEDTKCDGEKVGQRKPGTTRSQTRGRRRSGWRGGERGKKVRTG